MTNGQKTFATFSALIAWSMIWLFISDLYAMPVLRAVSLLPTAFIAGSALMFRQPAYMDAYFKEEVERDALRAEQGQLVTIKRLGIFALIVAIPLTIWLFQV
jgi:hypothetical protein